MILADKLIWLRKKNGLSQEEFAEKIDVSRQAVSRWEGAQTYPDLTKIVLISKLFGVSTDYLLIDELDDENKPAADAIATGRNGSAEGEVSLKAEEDPGVHVLTKEEADAYISVSKRYGIRCAFASVAFILSVIPILILSVYAAVSRKMSYAVVVGVGSAFFALLVAAGCCVLFVKNGEYGKYRYILSEPFSYASVLKEQIMIQKYKFISYYNALTAIGVLVVLLCTVPTAYFLLRGIWQGAIAFLTVALVVAVPIFIYAVTRMNSYKNLLDKGRNRKLNKAVTTVFVSTAYWFVMIEISMLYLFTASSFVSLKVAIPVMVAIVFTLYIIYLSVSIAIERKRSKNLRSC